VHTRTPITLHGLVLLFLFTSSSAPVRAEAPAAPIERFMQVDANLYRGGQPDETGYRYLRGLGVDTVISLRTDDGERALVESLGMKWVHMPMSFRPFGWGDDFSADDVQRFFAIVDSPESGTVFVHCKRGADRTGAMAGLYRVARQGWSVDKAFDEARDLGMRWWFFPVKGKMREFAPLVASAATSQ